MDLGNITALGSALLAAVVAIVVPVWTFKRTLELERMKWVRDQRAQLYIDILAEAYAEKQWFLNLMTYREITLIEARDGDGGRDSSRGDYPQSPDLRLNPVERANLGARSAVFASKEVSMAFNAFNGALGKRSLIPPQSEGEAHMTKIQAEELFETLSTTIRNELGADAKLNLEIPRR
jgi:hypothetical protein